MAAAIAVAGIVLLRVSWGLPRRAHWLNALAWSLLAAAHVLGWTNAGAWGTAIIALAAMSAATAALALAASRAAPSRRQGATRQIAVSAAAGNARPPLQRVLTFFLVAGLGMGASLALAVAAWWSSRLAGGSEVAANVIALFAAPIAWTMLSFLILMTPSRKAQFAILAAGAATAIPAILARSMS